MSVASHLLFLACVALASVAQNLTGFAFGLILLGLTAVLHLASLGDVANVVSVLVLVNAAITFGRTRPQLAWPVFGPALAVSQLGVGVGVALLGWFSTQQVTLLRFLLGCAIVICAFMLVLRASARAQQSGLPSFLFFSGVSGVMGGLFASAGPPMVYQLYRQPWPADMIRHSLIVLFAANAVLRLALVLARGQFSMTALWLTLEALPLVMGLTWLARRHPSRLPIEQVRRAVFVLLLIAGLALVLPPVLALAA
ncbi:TSUP family transporter [Janthinobacterium sp. LB2P49]|uniref:TSUP family transporter n=1 Tax=Janthinobacterium sp. LB2P49 TaxID=3424198 RepID=UPI003F1F0DA8